MTMIKIKSKLLRFFVIHGLVICVAIFLAFFFHCPIKHLFGISCPGCGMTRAHLALLRLDFKEAFHLHPMFPVVVPMVLYTAHRGLFKKRLSEKIEFIILYTVIFLFAATYIYRLMRGERNW